MKIHHRQKSNRWHFTYVHIDWTLAWITLVKTLKAKSNYFSVKIVDFNPSPKNELALVLKSQSCFHSKVLKSKEQLTFTKCDSSHRTFKSPKNPSPCKITSQTTTLAAILPGTWQGISMLQGWNQAGNNMLYHLTTMTWKFCALG